jgi:hypothetical protein
MESKLAKYLGMTKPELHDAIKTDPVATFAKKVENGKTTYDSVEEITEETEMMARIHGFQEWAASQFHYSLPPYKTETDDLGTTGLLFGGKAP